MSFAYTKKLNFSFLEALDEVRIAFAEKWFWVVSNVNIWEKIRASVDINFKEYVVFWLCNSRLAHKFLSENMSLWVFMPCTIAVYQKDDWVYISAWLPDPLITSIISTDKIDDYSYEVTVLMKRVIDSI